MTLNCKNVYRTCTPVTTQWKELGISLGVEKSTLDIIQVDNPHNARKCLLEMIDEWLKRESNPTWKSLSKALSHIDSALAENVSKEHGCNYISPTVSHSFSQSGVSPAFLTQSCGCGECTIKEWVTSRECPNIIRFDNKPKVLVLNQENKLLINDTYDHQAKLARETKGIAIYFRESCAAETWRALKQMLEEGKISIPDIVFELNIWLENPFPMITQLHELQHQFHLLRVSWYNFGALHHLAELFLSENRNLIASWDHYLSIFKGYCDSRNLKEYVNVFFSVEKENVFLLEVDDRYNNFTLSDVDDLSESLSLALDIPSVSLHLVTVGTGSLVIYFYYCYSDYLVIFKTLTPQQLQKMSQIKAYRILSLTDVHRQFTYDNMQDYRSNEQDEAGKEISIANPSCSSENKLIDSQLIQKLKQENELHKKQSQKKSQEIEKLKKQQVKQDQKELESENLRLKTLLEENQDKVIKLKEKNDVFQLWKKVNTPSAMKEDEAILKMKTELVKDLCNAIQIESISVEHRLNGIVVCDNGDILTTQQDTHCITVWDKEGMQVRSIGRKGTKEGEFMYPTGLAITNDDQHILVTDHHRLQKLTLDGVCVKSVGSDKSGSSQLQFNVPGGIAVHPTSGQIFITEFHRIQVLNDDLSFSGIITLQDDVKQFKKPQDISLDSDGYLYVAEYDNHCITKLTPTGQYITRFDCQHGSAPGQLSHPSSLAISNNLVYVCEWGNHRVSVFDTQGRFLHCFGKHGSENREFIHPRSMTIDKQCNLYVNDRGNKRIIVHYMLL